MLFNSSAFAIFLVLSLIPYYLVPPARRKGVLLAVSLIFYGIWSVPYLLLLIGAALVSYLSGRMIASAETEPAKKRALVISLALLTGTLLVFKFAGVLEAVVRLSGSQGSGFFNRILAPLGISYYTFKLISYVMDVYWEKIPAEKDLAAFVLYPVFFPQILSGPIQRAGDFLFQVKKPIANNPERITNGLRLMLFGYFKKIVVADSLALMANDVFADPLKYNSPMVLLGCYAFVIQLYADFSGFTDIAIGVGRLFGIESPQNFNRPFYSPNLQVFWRRWHMTLTQWLADYVFMPLRMRFRAKGKKGIAAAITVNFVLIGLWHGANLPYLVFGLLHALYMCVSVFTLARRNAFFESRPWLSWARRIWAPLLTLQLWTLSEIFFRSESLSKAGQVLKAIFDFNFSKPRPITYGLMEFAVLVAAVLVMELVHWAQFEGRFAIVQGRRCTALRWTGYYVLAFAVLLFAKKASQQFIYFQF